MKNLIQKLKTGFIGLGLIGASYFNSVKAQENSISRYEELNKLGFVEALYLRYDSGSRKKYIPKYNTTSHKMLMIGDSGKVCSYPPLYKLDAAILLSKNFIKKTHYTKQELSYLAIGQANNLPFYAVNFEQNIEYTPFIFKERSLGHVFIRYDPD